MYQSINKAKPGQSLRTSEKVLLLVAFLALLFFVWDWFWLTPYENEQAALLAKEKTTQQDLKKLTIRKDLLDRLAESGPDAALKFELQRLNRAIEITDQKIEDISIDLSTSETVPGTIQMILANMQGLIVRQVVTLPAEKLIQEEADLELVRQGFELSFEGGFEDTMQFLRVLEKSEKLFYWESLHYQLTQPTLATVKLKIFVIGGIDG